MDYLTLKWIHILSSTVLFGTGIGLAFYFFAAHRVGNLASIQFTTRMVVKGDLIFTTPSGIVQIISGLLLLNELGIPLTEPWMSYALALFIFAGLCWLPVVWIQIRMRDIANNVSQLQQLPEQYWRLNKMWIMLGSLAFPALILVFWLMVNKPNL
ncbi:DUF2269 family protein [Maritalea myrionectae]|uniref:DUF2269 family protein n=1 Tax=Maritalea myrionectae TaxID=454601 RepID=UPI00048A289C|nr:DUF2269 domain-containing protein [Maritalea myrionectae]